MATPQLKEPLSTSLKRMAEEMSLLRQALEIAREDPAAFERAVGDGVPREVAVRQMELALDATATRVAGLGVASLLVPAPDDATLDHDR